MRIYLGHGASGTAASMQPYVAGLRRRGLEATAVDLPKRKAEESVPAWDAAVPEGEDVVVGGHSFGGRVASLSAANRRYAALVCFSYPLHRPGAPETAEARTAHWPKIAIPTLLLSGESDLFARLPLLREHAKLLPRGELVTYPKVAHGLGLVLDDALDRVAEFLRRL